MIIDLPVCTKVSHYLVCIGREEGLVAGHFVTGCGLCIGDLRESPKKLAKLLKNPDKLVILTQDIILDQISDKKIYRKKIAGTYARLLEIPVYLQRYIGYKKINKLIMSRWSMSGLRYIKDLAWKLKK